MASQQPKSNLLTNHQRYEEEVIPRSQIKNAPYNPRTISEAARRKLKAVIKKHGLVSPLVWNRRTGNLVAGHQRLAILDSLERTQNYSIKVACIDVADKDEKELNLALNNDQAMGDWDFEKLGHLIKEVDIIGAGFETEDVYRMLGFSPIAEQQEVMDDLAKKTANIKDSLRKARAKEEASDENSHGFYRVLVFQSDKNAQEWCKKSLREPEDVFIGGEGTLLVNGGFVEDTWQYIQSLEDRLGIPPQDRLQPPTPEVVKSVANCDACGSLNNADQGVTSKKCWQCGKEFTIEW